MVLDLWDHTQNLTDLEKYKHIPFGVVRARLLCLPAQPNTLLPPTRISTNTHCARRFVLQHRGSTGLNTTNEV